MREKVFGSSLANMAMVVRWLPHAAAWVFLAVGVVTAGAQDYPAWQNVTMDLSRSPVVTGAGATIGGMASQLPAAAGSTGLRSMSAMSVPDSIDAEVVALAEALGNGQAASGENGSSKAVRIFNWVRSNIEYEHYYGLRKGAALTQLEGSANDMDTCALLRDLLVAAGYPASNVQLAMASQAVDYTDLRDWMGLADEPFPGKTYLQAYGRTKEADYGAGISDKVAKQATFAWQFLADRGSGVPANSGNPFVVSDFLPGKASLLFDRMFVFLTVDGSGYLLDPSQKTYEKTAGIDLLSASGYSRSEIQLQAGGTSDANSTFNLNATSVGTYLAGRSTALLSYLSANAHGASLAEIVNGRRIIKQPISNLGQGMALPDVFASGAGFSTWTVFQSTSDPTFAPYKTTVRFQYVGADGIDYTIPTADLKGQKITLTFSGNTAELRLDDAAPVDTGTVPDATMNLAITVTHPGTRGASSETKSYRKATSGGSACSYAIIYGFDASSRLLEKRQQQLKNYKDGGKADDTREVRTELLNIMGLTWLHQTKLCNRLLAAKNHVIPLSHHRFGRMAQEAGFYVDVGLQLSGDQTDDGVADDGRYDNVFHLGSLFWSAMEHGVIQQLQAKADGSPYDAVSTVNILRAANSEGGSQKLFLARASNWAAIKSSLTGYDVYNGVFDLGESFSDTNGNGRRDEGEPFTDQTIKQNLEWLVNNSSAQLFLPQSANVTQGIWTGTGWVIRSPGIAGMIISGGYSGGYSTSIGTVSSPIISTNYSYNPIAVYNPPTMPVVNPYVPPPPAAPRYYGADPVDMGTGGFTYAAEDMATGTEGAPRGLAFSRNYSSNLATRDDQNIGFGWTHNFHIRAESRTASEEVLGLGSAPQAAMFLTAIVAASDLYRTDATPKEWGAAALTVGWFVDQMRNSAVSVRIGKDMFQFISQPDGSYSSPTGSTMTLTKSAGAYHLQQRLGNRVDFDSTGKAISITDVDDRAATLSYNANNTLNFVQDAVGRRFTFGYSGERITSVTDSTSPTRSVSFAFDEIGNLISATDPESKVSWFDYAVAGDPGGTLATDHRIVRLRNHDGETITQNVYDSLGRVERQFLHGDPIKAFHLYYTGRDNFEVNPEGGTTHYFYDDRGRAIGRQDAEGNTSAIGYDGQDRVISRTSPTGEVTGYAHDAANNLTRIDHPRASGSTHMAYDGLNRLRLVTDPNGIQTEYVYFSNGYDAGKDRPQSVIAAKGTAEQSTTTYAYTSSGAAIGRVSSITDGDGLVTTKTYDSYGQPDITTAPGGFATNENYSERGNLDSIVDPSGRTSAYSYNQRRQATGEVADQSGIAAATDTGIDNQARVSTVTAPADNGGQRPQESRTYSPTDKVRLKKLNGTTVAETSYDSRDWAASAKDAANRTTTFGRKANGDIAAAQRPGARTTTFSYDGDSRILSSSNPGANTGTRTEGFAYSTAAGGPRTIKTEADGLTVRSDFDRQGRLRFLQNRKGSTFEFRYDALGRRTHVITPQGSATVTSYKKNGRVASVTEPSGDSATFNYNPTTGRLSSVDYAGLGGGTVNYTSYDSNGNLLALNENGANGISRTYDALNRVTSYTSGGNTIGYRYYPSGKLAKLVYPGGTDTGVGHVEYTYNADGRLYQVIDKLTSTNSPRTTTYRWNTDGRLDTITRPNGTTRTISYDSAGRPNGISESAGLSWTIGYWSSDDIKTLDLTPAIPANQLSAVPNASMTFDSANQLSTFNGQSVTHDLDGNMLTGPKPDGGTALYSYDSRNRLTGVGVTAYSYNAENNRIGIQSATETTTLVVDPEGALPKVLSRTKNGLTTRYVYGAGLQYEVSSAEGATYYHYDQTGNTAALSNQAGAIIDRMAYSPYGTIRYRQSNFDTPFLYGGFFAVMTDANGLVNMRARYYNPATMRFLNSDPAQDGLNWYAYASGNPIGAVDPTGLASWQPDAIYQSQIRGNTEVMQLLQDRKAYIEDVSIANNVDSDIVRAIILHESRGFGDRFERLEAQASWIRRGTAGSYGYAQLGPDARRASNLSIEQAQTMSGSINGAAKWVSVSQTDLISKGVSNPSVSQVASQYNYARQDGLVSNYGKQVNWTYNQIQSGSTGGFHQASSAPRK